MAEKTDGTERLAFGIPPHANAEVHRTIMRRLGTMTPSERRQTLIDAGILTQDGKLADRYAEAGE